MDTGDFDFEYEESVIVAPELAAKISWICQWYIEDVKTAKVDIIQLRQQLDDFYGVLDSFIDVSWDRTLGSALIADHELRPKVVQCFSMLKDLKEKIDRKSIGDRARRKLGLGPKWPLKHHEVTKVITSIEYYRSCFKLVRQIYQEKIDKQLAKNPGLDGLRAAKGATFDSDENDKDYAECLPGTRTELLRQVEEWAASPKGNRIFWLHGVAGTGKSTIARAVARHCKENGSLAASFFFKGGEGDRGNAQRLFPTLAKQLATCIPQLISSIRDFIERDPDIPDMMPREQFDRLILRPLLEMEERERQRQRVWKVIVIDGLDECEGQDEIEDILKILSLVKKLQSVYLRFFLTSRTEWAIRLGSTLESSFDSHKIVTLHEISTPMVEDDISSYFNHQFSQLRYERSLPPNWPGKKKMQALVERAVPLFISAATLYRFISDPQWNPEKRLEAILADQTVYTSKMDGIYMLVLNQLLTGQNDAESQQSIHEFKEIVGVIALLNSPLSTRALSRLLNVETNVISNLLASLHSVLHVPGDLDTPIRIIHSSFRDFLLDPKRKHTNPFWIDENEIHLLLFMRCVEVMQHVLKKNICCLRSYGTRRSNISVDHVNKHLAPEVQYACRYWTKHLMQIQNPVSELSKAVSFLCVHFLHWAEAMALLGLIIEVLRAIDTLQSIAQEDESLDASEFLRDALRFIVEFRHTVRSVPLQLYSTALVFAPYSSIVRGMFSKDLPEWISGLPEVDECWSPLSECIRAHSFSVLSLAFSPDGRLLASGSRDMKISLWDTRTGKFCQHFDGHSGAVRSVTFSPNSRLLATASEDMTVKLWDLTTGELFWTFSCDSDRIISVCFSPDGQLLVSGCTDGEIKFWNPATGELLQTIVTSDGLEHIAFTPDGRLLASSSKYGVVEFWDPATGELRKILKGNIFAFSPDGKLLASYSNTDNKLELWDAATGELYQTFRPFSGRLISLYFSTEGHLMAAGTTSYGAIGFWTVGMRKCQVLGYSGFVESAAFSPDGRLLATGSCDRKIRLWDLTTNERCQTTVPSYIRWLQKHVYRSVTLDVDEDNPIDGMTIARDSATGQIAWVCSKTNISIRRDRWLSFHGEDILWIPPEYDPVQLTSDDDGNLAVLTLRHCGSAMNCSISFRFHEVHEDYLPRYDIDSEAIDDVPASQEES